MITHRRATALRIAMTVALTLLCLTPLMPASANGAADLAAKTDPIYIGQILPLTGASAYPFGPGRALEQGAQLGLQQINAHGGVNGRPLKLVLVDNHSTLGGTIAAFKRLARSGHITAILGPNGSREITAMTPFVRRAGIPATAAGGAPVSMTQQANPWVFRIGTSPTYQDRVLALFAVSTLHLTKVALIHNADRSTQESGARLRADLRGLGVTPVTEQSFTASTSDLTAQVLAIKKSGATGLLSIISLPPDYVLLARQLRQVGLHLTWIGNPAIITPGVLSAGALFYGTYAGTPYAPGQSTEAAAFDRASQARFHEAGNFASAYCYDALQILAMVMRRVGTNPRAIRRGILAIRGYRGALGTYNFESNGDGLHQYTIVQNVQGRLRVVKVLSF